MDLKADWWKLGLVIVAVIALAVSVSITLFGGPAAYNQADYAEYVDVGTGDLFRVPLKGRSLPVPMSNPDDLSRRTLFPVEERNGKFFVKTRYFSPESFEPQDYEAVVDVDTGEIAVASGDWRRINIREYLERLGSN